MKENRSPEEVVKLRKLNRRNSAYQPRTDGLRWNISMISRALNLDRRVVGKRLKAAELEPDGTVHGTAVWETSRALPVIFGHVPKNPK